MWRDTSGRPHPSESVRARIVNTVAACARPVHRGRVLQASGLVVEGRLPQATIGDLVRIEHGTSCVLGEVVGFRGDAALVMAFGDIAGITTRALVSRVGTQASIGCSPALLGRVVDPFGRALDGKRSLPPGEERPIRRAAPAPVERARIEVPLSTGVRVIDSMLTLGRGQRIGLFAGAGVGKTVLIRQIAAQTACDVKVIALIGERGSEVQDLLAHLGLERTCLVVATSDRAPLERARGALAATAIAEYFRDRGANVLLVVDSLTRYAMALREIGLAAGEMPATRGYPPSVFAAMPRLLERAAPLAGGGSITGVYTVLAEGDDLSDPVADNARSLLDGHIVLSRDLASRGHFPAVDVLGSVSRVMRQVVSSDESDSASRARSLIARRRDAEELQSIGAYEHGRNPELDHAAHLGEQVVEWTRQSPEQCTAGAQARADLGRLVAGNSAEATSGQ